MQRPALTPQPRECLTSMFLCRAFRGLATVTLATLILHSSFLLVCRARGVYAPPGSFHGGDVSRCGDKCGDILPARGEVSRGDPGNRQKVISARKAFIEAAFGLFKRYGPGRS